MESKARRRTSPPFVAIGPEELDDKHEVHTGDEILCPHCQQWHELKGGTDSKGNYNETILAYKCAEKVYIAAIDNKLILRFPATPGVMQVRYK